MERKLKLVSTSWIVDELACLNLYNLEIYTLILNKIKSYLMLSIKRAQILKNPVFIPQSSKQLEDKID